jgi:hypothetical protein
MAARRGPACRLLNCTDGRLVVGSELLDNSFTHKTPAIRTWLLRHPSSTSTSRRRVLASRGGGPPRLAVLAYPMMPRSLPVPRMAV